MSFYEGRHLIANFGLSTPPPPPPRAFLSTLTIVRHTAVTTNQASLLVQFANMTRILYT